MYRSGSLTSTTTFETNKYFVLDSISNNNIKKVKELVNKNNANNILNKRLKWTALHYALSQNVDKEILEYLISITDENLKDINGSNLKTFSFNHNNTIYVDIYENKFNIKQYDCEVKDKKINDLNEKINFLNNTNDTLSTNIRNLRNINDKLKNEKIINNIIIKENNDLKDNNKNLKRKLDESEKAFDNLLKKIKK